MSDTVQRDNATNDADTNDDVTSDNLTHTADTNDADTNDAAINKMTGSLRLLFVCTGNTCRSPLAEAIARYTAQLRGIERVAFASAGVFAARGGGVSTGSRAVGELHEIDLADHTTQVLTHEMVKDSDLVLCMDRSHLDRVVALGGAGKAALLTSFAAGREDPADGLPVVDPFGGGPDDYARTYDELDHLIRRALDRLDSSSRP